MCSYTNRRNNRKTHTQRSNTSSSRAYSLRNSIKLSLRILANFVFGNKLFQLCGQFRPNALEPTSYRLQTYRALNTVTTPSRNGSAGECCRGGSLALAVLLGRSAHHATSRSVLLHISTDAHIFGTPFDRGRPRG